jgi:hypothetical protein
MGIRAKFKVASVTQYENDQETVEMQAANGRADTANAQWSKWTPSGKLTLTINNPDARGKLLPGKYYFLDLTEAAEDAI